jgi:ATP-binding cassette subfamily F protein uup
MGFRAMPLLVSCQSLTKTYGARPLFEDISLSISDGDRLGLIGPNGSGKSTLLRILAGEEQPDSGSTAARKLAKVGYVAQEVVFPPAASVLQILQSAVSPEEGPARIPGILGQAGFENPDAPAGSLSGGWKRRLAIARELVKQPDVLLLDEPTNHLDLEGILWLEKLLIAAPFASVVISHDRYFLENVATEMAEMAGLYPGGMFRVKGRYSEFLVRKEDFLSAQTREQQSLANQVRREVEWLRRGPKARATKAKARIDAAGRLIQDLAEVSARQQTSTAQIDFTASGRRTKNLVEARGVTKTLGERTLFRGLDLLLRPGVRLGLVGANGSGKTTLLRILNGEIASDVGTIERAEALRIVYFDQNREQLDSAVTLRRALAPEGDSVMYRDQPVHVAGWAKRFLFRPEQLETAVGRLSGGEQARVLIARLMLQPADVLLLDEPTNDLDIPTLEVLEESLLEFPGALALVTHDRYLLDRVSTTVLALDGEGGAQMFADYSQWEQAQAARRKSKSGSKSATEPAASVAGRRRLSYLDGREWESMEEKILRAEESLEARRAAMQEAAADAARLPEAYREMLEAQEEVDRLYARWAELEAKFQGA